MVVFRLHEDNGSFYHSNFFSERGNEVFISKLNTDKPYSFSSARYCNDSWNRRSDYNKHLLKLIKMREKPPKYKKEGPVRPLFSNIINYLSSFLD